MLHFEGDKDFAIPPAALWPKLSDARFLIQCIPEIQSVSRAEADAAVFKIRPGLSFVPGTLTVELRLVPNVADQAVGVWTRSKGIGSSADVVAGFSLAPLDQGTRVHWTTEIQALGGLLKAVPQGLIQAAAQKVIVDLWSGIAARAQERDEG
ncbi:MAG: SRPBCC family protein [Planctomycetes bacterium]|nr:SRPBCC family protein [Planctomycetota bacterium]